MNYIIAGGSKGLGREVSIFFANNGSKVEVIARSSDLLDSMKSEVKENFRENISTIEVNLTDSIEVEEEFRKIKKKLIGRTTLIICAATWLGEKSVKNISNNDLKKAIDLNFFTGFNPINSFINNFEYSPEEPNKVIVLGATASHRSGAGLSSFAIPKCALRFLCQSLAREEGSNGLHVCHITIDGLIYNKRTTALNLDTDPNKYMRMENLTQLIKNISDQPKDCWTFELDVRPYNERF